jgi:thiol:disulfide interchange protein DsbD
MGTAIGYALTQPPAAALSVFTSLAIGLALPYVVLTCVPALGGYLPRPGPWMETLKQLLAFPLLATVVWLIWVVSLQGGPVAVLTVLTALLLLGFASWISLHWTSRFAKVAATIVVIGALGLEMSLAVTKAAPDIEGVRLAWEPYSTARVEELLQQGKPIFVDFTAAWCVTCQVNERFALATPVVMAKMREVGVVALRADWTSANAEITRALQRFGRDGVPLYLLYGGSKEDPPRILPQLLTSHMVLTELERLPQRSGL